ncbi:signal peptidase II [Arcanobacterium haemolyticum]|nr:signal peptidase II [Arcanobacterium haemolyticum]
MTRRVRFVLSGLLCGLLLVGLDQATKQWALTALPGKGRTDLIGHFFGVELIFNPGAAFSLGVNSTWVFTIIATGVVLALPVWMAKTTSFGYAVTLGAVWGGAAGNLIDRLIREPGFGRGHVVDFLAYGDFFVGNVADIVLFVAIVVLLAMSLRGVPFVADEKPAEAAVQPDLAETVSRVDDDVPARVEGDARG